MTEIPIEVHDLMRRVLTQRGIEKWWDTGHRELNGYTPHELWYLGDHERVLQLISGYTNPSFS